MADKRDNPLAQFVQRQMDTRKLSVRKFAAESKIGQQTISTILSGAYGYEHDTYPHIDVLMRLAEFTHTPLASLVDLLAPPEYRGLSGDSLRVASRLTGLSDDELRMIDTVIDGIRLRRSQAEQK